MRSQQQIKKQALYDNRKLIKITADKLNNLMELDKLLYEDYIRSLYEDELYPQMTMEEQHKLLWGNQYE